MKTSSASADSSLFEPGSPPAAACSRDNPCSMNFVDAPLSKTYLIVFKEINEKYPAAYILN